MKIPVFYVAVRSTVDVDLTVFQRDLAPVLAIAQAER